MRQDSIHQLFCLYVTQVRLDGITSCVIEENDNAVRIFGGSVVGKHTREIMPIREWFKMVVLYTPRLFSYKVSHTSRLQKKKEHGLHEHPLYCMRNQGKHVQRWHHSMRRRNMPCTREISSGAVRNRMSSAPDLMKILAASLLLDLFYLYDISAVFYYTVLYYYVVNYFIWKATLLAALLMVLHFSLFDWPLREVFLYVQRGVASLTRHVTKNGVLI